MQGFIPRFSFDKPARTWDGILTLIACAIFLPYSDSFLFQSQCLSILRRNHIPKSDCGVCLRVRKQSRFPRAAMSCFSLRRSDIFSAQWMRNPFRRKERTCNLMSPGSGEDFVRSQRIDDLDEAELFMQAGESYIPYGGFPVSSAYFGKFLPHGFRFLSRRRRRRVFR